MTWNKRTRYFNTPKAMVYNKTYDSKFEAQYAMLLEQAIKDKQIEGFESHVRIPLVVNGYTVCDYYVDFAVFHKGGLTEYIECKGYPTDVFKLKWKLFCALFEDDENIKITLEMQGKQKPPKLRKSKF